MEAVSSQGLARRRQGEQVQITSGDVSSGYRKEIFLWWEQSLTGTTSPGTQSLHGWRFPRCNWTRYKITLSSLLFLWKLDQIVVQGPFYPWLPVLRLYYLLCIFFWKVSHTCHWWRKESGESHLCEHNLQLSAQSVPARFWLILDFVVARHSPGAAMEDSAEKEELDANHRVGVSLPNCTFVALHSGLTCLHLSPFSHHPISKPRFPLQTLKPGGGTWVFFLSEAKNSHKH